MPKSRDSSQLVYRGQNFSVRRHSVILAGGQRLVREVIHHGGSAVMIPVFDDGRILMERQYRVALGRQVWELPAGTIDSGETPLQTARRELAEETGYTSRSWSKIAEFFPSPGLMNEKMTIFVARNIQPGPSSLEPDERISTKAYTMRELLAMIEKKKIVDGKSMIGLLYFDRWGK